MKLNPVAYTGVLFIVSLSTAALSHKRVCICQDLLWQLLCSGTWEKGNCSLYRMCCNGNQV